MFINRWHIFALLADRKIAQRQIATDTHVGIGTVSRANRALRGPGGEFLRQLLSRVNATGDSP